MSDVVIRKLKQKVEKLNQEVQNLERRIKCKDSEIKCIKMNGPDQVLLEANVELQDELKDLKDSLLHTRNLDAEKEDLIRELNHLKAKGSDQCKEIRRLRNRVKDLERIDRISSLRVVGKVRGRM